MGNCKSLLTVRQDDIVNYKPEKITQTVNEEQTDRLRTEFIPLYNPVQMGTELLHVVLQIEAQKKQPAIARAPIDLVCVVDVSASMEGKKLTLVKNSLRFIQKILSPEDRISLVSFDHNGEIKMGWIRNVPENKPLIKESILKLQADGGTNILSGIDLALQLMKRRTQKNPVTLMFLLSDGQDTNKDLQKGIQERIKTLGSKDVWGLKVFGYGRDHDSKQMEMIAQSKNGSYTFIQDIQKASEHFILAISGMLSLYAKNIKIQVKPLNGVEIQQIYGEEIGWNKLNGDYSIEQNYLLDGQSQEFAMNIKLPQNKQQTYQALQLNITGENIIDSKIFEKSTVLTLQFDNQQSLPNQIAELFLFKAKASDIIRQAILLSENQMNDQAIQLINTIINEIEGSDQVQNPILQHLLTDLQKSKEMCKKQTFQKQGKAFMLNKQRNLIVQGQDEMDYCDNWNDDQVKNMEQFKNGELCLSMCEFEDLGNADDLNDLVNGPNLYKQTSGMGSVENLSDEEQQQQN